MTVRALIINPGPARACAIEGLVAATVEIAEAITVSDGRQCLRLLREGSIDLIFFAWTAASADQGLELLRTLRKHEDWAEIPFLLFTASSGGASVARAFDAGASDCLFLTGPEAENLARIRSWLRQRERSSVLRKKMQHLAHMAVTDLLTGLFNRAYFEATIELETARSQRTGYPISLLLIDIDHFKRINDTYGHPIGDDVIRTVAALSQETVRKSDVVCRYGGEEFAILLPGTTAADAFQLAERLRGKVANIAPNHLPISCPITVSIGITCSNGRSDATPTQLIEEADIALYSGKKNGRNRSELHSGTRALLPQAASGVFPSLTMGHA